MLGIELKGDRGYVKEGLVVNSDGFVRCRARGGVKIVNFGQGQGS